APQVVEAGVGHARGQPQHLQTRHVLEIPEVFIFQPRETQIQLAYGRQTRHVCEDGFGQSTRVLQIDGDGGEIREPAVALHLPLGNANTLDRFFAALADMFVPEPDPETRDHNRQAENHGHKYEPFGVDSHALASQYNVSLW